MRQLDFDALEKKTTPLPKALAWRRAAELELRVEARGHVVNGRFTLVAVLANPTDRPLEVVAFPVHGWAPFTFEVRPSEAISRKPYDGPPLPPPAPAPPLVFTVPAHTRVRFPYSVPLADYVYRSVFGHTLDWTFHFWTGDRATGSVTVAEHASDGGP